MIWDKGLNYKWIASSRVKCDPAIEPQFFFFLDSSVLSKDFLQLFLVWNKSIIHFNILLNKNNDIVSPLINKF
jgi:hypothetical protein